MLLRLPSPGEITKRKGFIEVLSMVAQVARAVWIHHKKVVLKPSAFDQPDTSHLETRQSRETTTEGFASCLPHLAQERKQLRLSVLLTKILLHNKKLIKISNLNSNL